MPVINVSISEVNAKREKTARGNINVRSSPTIKSIIERKMDTIGLDKVLAISFEFKTEYTPAIGKIQLTGEVLYLGADNKKVLSEWKKNKKLNEKIAVEVINAIFRRCIVKATGIAEDLQLPPPIQIPRVRSASGSEYIG